MTKLEKIERDIQTLGKEDLRRLADWFADFQADLWDEQIEADAKAGKLDAMAERALANHKAGRTEPI